jgi:hypothetical protein
MPASLLSRRSSGVSTKGPGNRDPWPQRSSTHRRPLSEHPLSIHPPDNRHRSRSFATVRAPAFSVSRRGKSDGGERRRPCQQGLISPVSLVRSQPPPHFPRQDAKSRASLGCVRARRPVRASTGASTARATARMCTSSPSCTDEELYTCRLARNRRSDCSSSAAIRASTQHAQEHPISNLCAVFVQLREGERQA